MIKSKKEDLRARGLIASDDIEKVMELPYEQLIGMINSDVAVERSAAIFVLSKSYQCESRFITTILERQSIEKCLYTKIEIGKALEKGDAKVAGQMVNYLGKIGTNQHKILPKKVSKKISYPLPRDIISRSLGRMSTDTFPVLLGVLSANDELMIAEILDAIGLMIFYNRSLATSENLKLIIKSIKVHANHMVILWKFTICLSAFPLNESVQILEQIENSNLPEIIRKEAKRSHKIIC